MRGVSLDAHNPGPGSPTMRQLSLLVRPGLGGHRLVAFNEAPFFQYVGQLQRTGFGVALVLTSDSFDMRRAIPAQCEAWAQRVRPDMFILGNEFNIAGDASWPTSPDVFVTFWNSCAPAIRAVNPTVPLYTGGMFCGADTEALIVGLWPRLAVVPDGVDFHPYLTVPDFNYVRNTLDTRISVGEWNDSTPEGVRQFQAQLNRETDHSFFFCYHDLMVPPLGLVDVKGQRKPTWYAYHEALGGNARRRKAA